MSVPPKFSPGMPSLEELGLSTQHIRAKPSTGPNMVSDGRKRVNYRPNSAQSVRPFQSPPSQGPVPSTQPQIGAIPKQTRPTQPGKRPAKGDNRPWTDREEKIYPTLTITPHGEAIAGYIQELPILAIDFPTGTGKTRYIPYLMATKGYMVRVAIPTTVAVRDAYQFQRKYSTLRVGYAAGREIHYNVNDQLVYGTTGHFTVKILFYYKMGRMDLIRTLLGDIFFLDEVHTSTSQITILIGLLRYLFPDDSSRPKIVFSTATFNHGDIMDHFPDFPVYKQTELEYPFPVTDIFLSTPRDPLRDNPNNEIERIIREELQRWQSIDPSDPSGSRKYHGIVFRPGVDEVLKTIEYLERAFSIEEPVQFFPAYSGLSKAELDEIYAPSDLMKIVIGTNIIESGVTINDVGFVIDDFLEKIAETSSTGGQKLSLAVISQAASLQRRGRTGRTIEGRSYKLVTPEYFAGLAKFRSREIDRVPIYDIILQLMEAGLDVIEVLKINPARFDQGRRILIDFGMIQSRGSQYVVTEAGQFVSSIPLSIQNAYMIYLGYQQFLSQFEQGQVDLNSVQVVLRSTIAVAAMLEAYGPSYFFVPRKERSESQTEYTTRRDAHIEQYHEKFRGATDIHTMVNIFWEMMSDINLARQYDQASRNKLTNYIRDWSNDNSMNHKKIKEFFNIFQDIEAIVESKLSADPGLKSVLPVNAQNLSRGMIEGGYDQLGTQIAEIFSRAYSTNRFYRDVDRKGRLVYKDRQTGVGYQINRNSSFNSMVINAKTGPAEIIAAQTIEVHSQRRINLTGIIISQDYFAPELRPMEVTGPTLLKPVLRPGLKPSVQLPAKLPTKLPAQPDLEPVLRPPPLIQTVTGLSVNIPTPSLAKSVQTQLNAIAPTQLFETGLSSPTKLPSMQLPTKLPGAVQPGLLPSTRPSALPTKLPSTKLPSTLPTKLPSTKLPSSTLPAKLPSALPTQLPSLTPLQLPSALPTKLPSSTPSQLPLALPTKLPSSRPTISLPSGTIQPSPESSPAPVQALPVLGLTMGVKIPPAISGPPAVKLPAIRLASTKLPTRPPSSESSGPVKLISTNLPSIKMPSIGPI